jgi:hypothetical protein
MSLEGKTVRFRLAESGRAALSGIALEAEFVDGLVVDENQIGLWIYLPEFEGSMTALLRWEHFTTALVDYAPDVPAERFPAGFRP